VRALMIGLALVGLGLLGSPAMGLTVTYSTNGFDIQDIGKTTNDFGGDYDMLIGSPMLSGTVDVTVNGPAVLGVINDPTTFTAGLNSWYGGYGGDIPFTQQMTVLVPSGGEETLYQSLHYTIGVADQILVLTGEPTLFNLGSYGTLSVTPQELDFPFNGGGSIQLPLSAEFQLIKDHNTVPEPLTMLGVSMALGSLGVYVRRRTRIAAA